MSAIQIESDRLRKIARAHAAGDLSREDYRNIRAAVIESFASDDEQVIEPTRIGAAVPRPPFTGRMQGLDEGLFDGESPAVLAAVIAAGALLVLVIAVLYLAI